MILALAIIAAIFLFTLVADPTTRRALIAAWHWRRRRSEPVHHLGKKRL